MGYRNYCMQKQGYERLSFEHGMQTCLDNLKVLLESVLRAEFSGTLKLQTDAYQCLQKHLVTIAKKHKTCMELGLH